MNIKKMFTVFALGVALMFSLSAAAMSPVTDQELATVRGSGQPVAGSDLNTVSVGSIGSLLKNPVESGQFNTTSQTDSSVNMITRRSGVSIYVDVTMNIHFDVIAWGDADGFGRGGVSKAGYVGLSSLNVTGLHVGPRN